jgi:hypothetical protein
MNNIRNKVIMDLNYLLRYKEFLLNNKVNNMVVAAAGVPARKTHANFCSICGDDCVCMSSSYSSYRKLLNNKNLLLCSKYCSENVFKDCICL